MQLLYNFFGTIMRWIYETVIQIGGEPESVSYFAITLMLMAVVSKIISMPLTYKTTQNAKKTQDLQPKLEQLKKKYGYDERILQQKTMEFYRDNNVNAAGCSSCLPLIIQLVVILGLFGVVRNPELYIFDNAAQFDEIAKNFLWISDLTLPDPYFFGLPLLNALLQLVVQRMNPATKQQSQAAGGNTMAMMTYIMPIMIFFISVNWASALLLYWTFGNVLEVVVRSIMMVFMKRKPAEEV